MKSPRLLTTVELERIFPDYKDRPGIHTFRQCPVCGAPEWTSSEPTKDPPTSLLQSAQDSRLCRVCETVQYQSPIIFQWVCNVIGNRETLRDTVDGVGT